MKIHKDLLQGTDEWFELKKLKLSASHATAIGNAGKGLDTYIRTMVLDYILPNREKYTGKDMDRGNELEDSARIKYEFERNTVVTEVGFIEHCNNSGCSPDGLVDENEEGKGGIEIKARNDEKHFALLAGYDKVDSSTIWQMNMSMFISKRKWWDFISYNPNFKQSIYIERFYPDPIKQEKIKNGLEIGIKKLKELLNKEVTKNELLET